MINKEYEAGIIAISPQGTNSTMFTECCSCAICNYEIHCPSCGRNVIGWDIESSHQRGIIRWSNATRNWRRG